MTEEELRARANRWPAIAVILIILGSISMVVGALLLVDSTVEGSQASVIAGLSGITSGIFLFAFAAVLRKLFQIEFHLRPEILKTEPEKPPKVGLL